MNAIESTLPMLLVALAVVGVSTCAYMVMASMVRMLRYDGRLRLCEALHGQGLAQPDVHSDGEVRALGIATRRCITCAEHARCDHVLAAGDWTMLREICPNTSYIDGLRPALRA
jgi:hypothetical protein